MRSTQFTILPPPEILKNDVECVRIAEYSGEEALSIKVSPNGLPGMVFHQNNGQERMTLLTDFLVAKFKQEKPRDPLVEESLRLIHTNIGALHIRDLLDALYISERQFERRFTQAVGLTPHVYVRLKRFNEAIRLIKTRRFERLTDVASALNFSDQSHFIRDIKAFSGMTPTSLSQKVDDFYHDQTGYSFV